MHPLRPNSVFKSKCTSFCVTDTSVLNTEFGIRIYFKTTPCLQHKCGAFIDFFNQKFSDKRLDNFSLGQRRSIEMKLMLLFLIASLLSANSESVLVVRLNYTNEMSYAPFKIPEHNTASYKTMNCIESAPRMINVKLTVTPKSSCFLSIFCNQPESRDFTYLVESCTNQTNCAIPLEPIFQCAGPNLFKFEAECIQ